MRKLTFIYLVFACFGCGDDHSSSEVAPVADVVMDIEDMSADAESGADLSADLVEDLVSDVTTDTVDLLPEVAEVMEEMTVEVMEDLPATDVDTGE